MAGKLSDKLLIVIITVVGSVVTAGITTFGVIRTNGNGITENQQRLKELKAQADTLGKPALPVGSVVASLLDAGEFAKAVGDPENFDLTKSRWTLADGKPAPGTDWAMLRSNAPVPNLCGVFLRGKSNGKFLLGKAQKDATGNDRKDIDDIVLGDYRDDTVGPHRHKLWINNASSQRVTGFVYNGDSTATFAYTPMMPMSDEAPETQPKNVTVNYFIKINDFNPEQ
jgi:hypothetical protein